MAPVLLDHARQQALGVRTARVEARSFERDLRVSGIVRVDETRQSHIHLKVMGFVEQVLVNFVGRTVRRGEPLLTVYSPDLLAAESELAQALAAQERITEGEFAASERRQAKALIDAARARLTLLDVPAEEIARLEKTRTPSRTLTIRSPLQGTVLSREVVDGMRVMPEMTLFVIADLREVWLLADVFESDLAAVKAGTHAVIRFAGGAAEERTGRVAFVAPTLNETTRSAQVRIEVPNKDGAVRPGLFADVILHVAGVDGLSVPEAAVIETGTRRIAFVESEPGRFEPRELHIGARAGGFVEILHGLAAGEQVAVSAQFMLDAESQIRGSSAPGGHGGH
jgi:Cu(I)/Ag(I) efflux system membrane fusion protein